MKKIVFVFALSAFFTVSSAKATAHDDSEQLASLEIYGTTLLIKEDLDFSPFVAKSNDSVAKGFTAQNGSLISESSRIDANAPSCEVLYFHKRTVSDRKNAGQATSDLVLRAGTVMKFSQNYEGKAEYFKTGELLLTFMLQKKDVSAERFLLETRTLDLGCTGVVTAGDLKRVLGGKVELLRPASK